MGKGKRHLTGKDRVAIQVQLELGKNFNEIGEMVGKDGTTISREVKGHMREIKKSVNRSNNDCVLRAFKDCPVSQACEHSYSCRREKCSGCNRGPCGENCDCYVKMVCERLKKPPYVCNGCEKFRIIGGRSCPLEKRIYDPLSAQKDYEKVLSESRQGLHISEDDLMNMQNILEPAIVGKKQSLNHVYSYASDALPVGQRTAYNYINNGVFPDIIRLDQPKAVRFKNTPIKKEYVHANKDAKYLTGRSHVDYVIHCKEIESYEHVETDCVEGRKGGNGRVLMSIMFPSCNMQLFFVLDAKTQENVVNVHTRLRAMLGDEDYRRLFSVILTDRGAEFRDPEAIERAGTDTPISKVFYCEAMNSNQKAQCERNHEELRRILPKGTDITFGQDKATLITNHIGNMPRPSYGNRSAYDLFVFIYGEEVAKKLGLYKIPARDVVLSPSLIR